MRLALAKFGYQQKFDAAQQEALARAFIIAPPTFDDQGAFGGWYVAQLVDLDKLPDFLDKVEIERMIRLPELEEVCQRDKLVLNKVVNVAVPGNQLLHIGEVKVAEDCCTDALQHDLDNGWSILAICPQPDQRRPDYILGKMKVPQ